MSKPALILIGAGGHAHSCIDVIEQQGEFHIAGLVGQTEEMGVRHLGYEVIATDHDLPELVRTYSYAFIVVGQIESPDARGRLHRRVMELGFRQPTIISPLAHVSRHAKVGAGSIVMHGAMVNAAAQVGDNCIINSRALVEHDATVGDHCHISTGAILNGNVRVGDGCYVGSGAVIRESVSIGPGCLIGMGLSVRRDLPDHTRFVGENKP